jgi:bifunctional non-homologous end joining protein LigD
MAKKESSLRAYRAKRDFTVTGEPTGDAATQPGGLSFVVQKHWARRLHYDFRLELEGSMKSWAIPKGPSLDPGDKRLAVHVEDHPIAYSSFEGTIPPKQYGAGKVVIWDRGTWQPIGNPRTGYRAGNLKFELHGEKLLGQWALVRIKGKDSKDEPWLLIKHRDAYARDAGAFSVVDELPDSVNKPAGKKSQARRGGKAQAMPRPRNGNGASPTASKDLPPEAVPAKLPKTLAPELATLVSEPPADSSGWSYEVKFDGYRLLVRVDEADVHLMTRNGLDWSAKLPELHREFKRLALPPGWYDGEVVVLNAAGAPDFGALQASFDSDKAQNAILYLFDVPYVDGFDLRNAPLSARRAVLRQLLERRDSPSIRFSDDFNEDPKSILDSACKLGLEGVIAKRRDSVYVSRRSADWIKLKCSRRQEFVVGGYTAPQGSRTVLGSLLLGVYDDHGRLEYAGNVGTGFGQATLRTLQAPLKRLATTRRPFAEAASVPGRPQWLKPQLVAEVSFSEWTRDGRLRHPVFHGLRTDKDPKSIRREQPTHVKTKPRDTKPRDAKNGARASAPATRPRTTHGERVVDPSSGTTKADLVAYYEKVGALALEHLEGRPVSLVRAPAGIKGQLFFQKHAETNKLPGVRQLDRRLDPGHPPLLMIESIDGILSAAQWNVIEFHTQNGRVDEFEHPDRIVFDLDPGEGVRWPAVREAAELLHAFLAELGVTAFLKTSGGKGLHIVAPIRPVHAWDDAKGFSQAVAEHTAATIPDRFVAKSGPRNRVGKIFIDYLRNGRGSTTVAAWSARARPGIGISVPLAWDELKSTGASDQWTIRDAQKRIAVGNKPWDGYATSAVALTSAMKKIGYRSGRKS